MSRFVLLPMLVALPLAATACIDDDPVTGDSSTSTEDTSESGEQGLAEWVPARGIAITEVEANQGTRVAVGGPDGAWVSGSDRNTFLVSERDTLIRVHWELDPGWNPHEVRAVLTIETPTQSFEHEQIVMVDGPSTPTALKRTFYFGLVDDVGEVEPGTTYQVELFERDTEQDATLPQLANLTPAASPGLLGFETTPMQMKIMFVPIHYVADGKDRRPDMSEDKLASFIDALYEQNPVQEVQYQVHSEIQYTQVMNQLGSLLPIMATLRDQEGADPNIYYHALIDIDCLVAGCGSSGTAGIAFRATDQPSDSLSRVAATIYYDLESSAETFVHELGHNQGFAHVECPNADAAGPDPTYPYTDGKIGNWGFGIRSYGLHNPTAGYDYMTYCGNTWASDWTFNKAYKRIKTLTAWDFGGPTQAGSELIGEQRLVGALYGDGSEEWFMLSGGIDIDTLSPGEGVEFEVDGERIQRPASVRTASDGVTQWVIAPLPEGVAIDRVDALTHLRNGEARRSFGRDEVRRRTP